MQCQQQGWIFFYAKNYKMNFPSFNVHVKFPQVVLKWWGGILFHAKNDKNEFSSILLLSLNSFNIFKLCWAVVYFDSPFLKSV